MSIGLSIAPPVLRRMADMFLECDITGLDIGAAVVGTDKRVARFLVKAPLIIAGFIFAEAVLDRTGCEVTWSAKEGEFINGSGENPIEIGRATGPICRLLQAERTALELMHRCSAVATITRQCVDMAKESGWKGRIAGTRKTTPGYMRLVEKAGVIAGGGDPHRFSLTTSCMLKDNHIDAVGGDIAFAVKKARELGGFTQTVEVECRNDADAFTAAEAGANIVMLDNFEPSDAARLATQLKEKFPLLTVEVSGGVTPDKLGPLLKELADSKVDIISMGCLTQAPPRVDISFKILKQG